LAKIGLHEWVQVTRAFASGNLLRYEGHFTADFESDLAKAFGVKHVLTVTSGTSALTAALAACKIGPGDEVLVPAYTWIATAAAVVNVGAVPILVDIDESLTIDPADIERKITPFTKAIIPVHMVNAPCDMDTIMAIAKKHRLLVIEDACQAVGVSYKGRRLGAIGDAGALSFNAYKNMNIGEGGAVITHDDTIFARARNYHDVGTYVRGHAETYNEPTFVGGNMRVTEIQGAMLGAQLKKLDPMLGGLRARRAAFAQVIAAGGKHRISPHNDPDSAVTLTVIFDTPEEAIAYAERGRAYRLFDNSKHVYTNWGPILTQQTFHPDMNPWKWARRPIDYSDDMCARTLDILQRTCRVYLGERNLPAALIRRKAKALAI